MIGSTFSTMQSKPMTYEDLDKIFNKLKDCEKPKALILLPSLGRFDMYEVDEGVAKAALTMQTSKFRFSQADIKPYDEIKESK